MRRLIWTSLAISALLLTSCTHAEEGSVAPLVAATTSPAGPSPAGSDRSATVPISEGPLVSAVEPAPTTIEAAARVAATSPPASPPTVPSTVAVLDTSGATTVAAPVAGPAGPASESSAGNVAPRSSGRSVDPSALVGAASLTVSTTTVPDLCAAAAGDMPCVVAGVVTPGPQRGVSVGEYQRNALVDPGAQLDVYFDQSRPHPEMAAICWEMGGRFTQRGDDGSPWAGWFYCEDVDH